MAYDLTRAVRIGSIQWRFMPWFWWLSPEAAKVRATYAAETDYGPVLVRWRVGLPSGEIVDAATGNRSISTAAGYQYYTDELDMSRVHRRHGELVALLMEIQSQPGTDTVDLNIDHSDRNPRFFLDDSSLSGAIGSTFNDLDCLAVQLRDITKTPLAGQELLQGIFAGTNRLWVWPRVEPGSQGAGGTGSPQNMFVTRYGTMSLYNMHFEEVADSTKGYGKSPSFPWRDADEQRKIFSPGYGFGASRVRETYAGQQYLFTNRTPVLSYGSRPLPAPFDLSSAGGLVFERSTLPYNVVTVEANHPTTYTLWSGMVSEEEQAPYRFLTGSTVHRRKVDIIPFLLPISRARSPIPMNLYVEQYDSTDTIISAATQTFEDAYQFTDSVDKESYLDRIYGFLSLAVTSHNNLQGLFEERDWRGLPIVNPTLSVELDSSAKYVRITTGTTTAVTAQDIIASKTNPVYVLGVVARPRQSSAWDFIGA